jgi:hypothetical protein
MDVARRRKPTLKKNPPLADDEAVLRILVRTTLEDQTPSTNTLEAATGEGALEGDWRAAGIGGLQPDHSCCSTG